MKVNLNMITKNVLSMVALSVIITASNSSVAQAANESAKPFQAKVGYFSLPLVKMVCPEAAETEALKGQAESQLKAYIEDANKRLQKAKDDKKPESEIQEMQKTLQTEVSAKQQALAQLIQSSNQMATSKIMQAATQVAKEKGLDLVVDGSGIFTGGQKVLDDGVDITKPIIKILAPNQELADSKPSSGKREASK